MNQKIGFEPSRTIFPNTKRSIYTQFTLVYRQQFSVQHQWPYGPAHSFLSPHSSSSTYCRRQGVCFQSTRPTDTGLCSQDLSLLQSAHSLRYLLSLISKVTDLIVHHLRNKVQRSNQYLSHLSVLPVHYSTVSCTNSYTTCLHVQDPSFSIQSVQLTFFEVRIL